MPGHVKMLPCERLARNHIACMQAHVSHGTAGQDSTSEACELLRRAVGVSSKAHTCV